MTTEMQKKKIKKTQFECNMKFITGLLLKFEEVIILFLFYGPIIIIFTYKIK